MRSMRTWAPIAAAAVGLLFLAGCSSTAGRADTISGLPTDLPTSPDPCMQYCREYVPPVTRKVPKLVKCAPGQVKEEQYTVMETTYRDVQVKPKTFACRTGCGTTCEEQLVETKPGGYRWVQTAGGCWKYEYCPPEFKWCTRTVKEEGVDYCVETPAEYKTVAESRPVVKTRRRYVPPKYEIRYVDQEYQPGHWRWRASPKPAGDSCGCRPAGKVTKVMESCAKCN
ncbi:MAG: hypothetical protein QNJ98_17030 [Planctomycetota bacterium]|nr:hypothetical protein [Planctomycetota bacterium]